MSVRRVALLTAGGFAPCLSAAVGDLIERYTEVAPEVEIIAYQYGYHGLLTGNYIVIDEEARKNAGLLRNFGGSPIGNSRVKLTNAKNLVERGLVAEGVDPLAFAAEQLRKDGVDVLHTIGGDDTNTTAADLAAYLHEHNYELTVVGLPKTIDNDVVPIRQSLGAWTAADEGANFAFNVIGEHRSNPRMLIVHECMGRNCGYLTAETALRYRQLLDTINPGQWFAKKFAKLIGAEKVMVQKSGYYSRAAAAHQEDLDLIKSMCDLAVECALRGEPGVIGQDEENGDVLTAIAFPRIAGGKPFNIDQDWFKGLMEGIGQHVEPSDAPVEH